MNDLEKRNLATVEALYAATSTGNWPVAETYLTDDFFVTESQVLPFAGVYRGRGALKELYSKVMGMMDIAGLETTGKTAGGDLVIYRLEFVLANPKGARAELTELFRLREGKVCEIRPFYFDPRVVADAVEWKRAHG
jgi:predicted SnoaL-like aldol condensation-catalyzing enzyme